jgi:DNA recombination protein RmuC
MAIGVTAVLCLVLGLGLGCLIGVLWASARERGRRQEAVAEADQKRAVAEARVAEIERTLADQKALLETAEARLGAAFRGLSAEALQANNRGFLGLAAETLVKPMREALERVTGQVQALERERGQAYGRLTALVEHMAGTQEKLQAEAGNLARALRSPTARGRWGELQLRRVVELAGMVERCDFDVQETLRHSGNERLRPDMVVKLPGGRHVAVDAKVPLEAYLDALEAKTDEAQRERLAAHAAHVRGHVHKLAAKEYWAALAGSPEFVVMFLPNEAIYGAALEQMPSLIEDAMSRRVLIATPTTLIALLQTVHFGWRQELLAENAKQVSEQGRVLYERLSKMVEHWDKVGQTLGRATDHFNAAVASFETRVMPSVRKLEDLGAGAAKTPSLSQIESRPRALSATDDAK